jgi:hypothetical protein
MYEQTLDSGIPCASGPAALSIANRYVHGVEEFDPTFEQLVEMGSSVGFFIAGEVALEQARLDPPEVGSDRFRQAGSMLVKAADARDHEPYSQYAANRARALYRLAQLPSLKTLYTQHQLPNRETIQTMYRLLVKQGNQLVVELDSQTDTETRVSKDLLGLLGQYSCLLLPTREILRGETIYRTAVQSSLAEAYGEDLLSNASPRAYDINIFQSADGRPLRLTDRLEVKGLGSRNHAQRIKAITTIKLHPDLALYKQEPGIARSIVIGCGVEANHPDRSARISRELDRRTVKLDRRINRYKQSS